MASKASAETVSFTTKGQIVIPRKLRLLYEIEPGTKATIETTQAGILIKPITAVSIRKGRGFLQKGKAPLSQEWAEHKVEERQMEKS